MHIDALRLYTSNSGENEENAVAEDQEVQMPQSSKNLCKIGDLEGQRIADI